MAPRVSIRGGQAAVALAEGLGCSLVDGRSARTVLSLEQPDILVLDDRDARSTLSWRCEARHRGILLVSIHDLGLGLGDADLVVDGSAVTRGRPPRHAIHLLGTRYAILSTRVRNCRASSPGRRRQGVVVTLGGGAHTEDAWRLAKAVRAAGVDSAIAVAGGFAASRRRTVTDSSIGTVPGSRLAAVLAASEVAVVAGGVTLYEACALGTPVVAVAVAGSQRPTIRAVAGADACIDGGALTCERDLARVARLVRHLAEDERARRRLTRSGRQLVDGRGAERVARQILLQWKRARRARMPR